MKKLVLAIVVFCGLVMGCGPDPDPVCEPPCTAVFHQEKIVDCICSSHDVPSK